MLCQAICIENEDDRLSDIEILTEQQILSWLECLVRKSEDKIQLSHFTIKKFLRMNPENVSSNVARKYLIKPTDHNYLLRVCLIHLMHDDFKGITCFDVSEVRSFMNKHPICEYVTSKLCDHTRALTNSDMTDEIKRIIQRFLSTPCEAF